MKIKGFFWNDNLFGTNADDEIYGYGGDDTIHGGDGNDIIDGGDGENWLFGEGGNDTIYSMASAPGFGFASEIDHIDGGTGTNTLYLQRDFLQFGVPAWSLDLSDPGKTAKLQDGTTITGIESLHFFGGDERNFVTGGISNNTLCGGGGADRLDGGPLGDVLDGGAGGDVLNGNDGDDDLISTGTDPDTIDGGRGFDTAEINRSGATMAYNFALKSNSPTPQDIGDGTTLVHVEKMFFWGGSGGDTLTAGGYGDTLHGGGGSDQLFDGNGNDWLDGGDQNDTIHSNFISADTIDGGNGDDTLYLDRRGFSAPLKLDLTDPATKQFIGDGRLGPGDNVPTGTSVVNVESVIFNGGTGDDVITGGRFDDNLNGGEGNDTLCGGTQQSGLAIVDRLDGGPGNDLLIGGPATDYFIFDSPLDPVKNVDHIANFAVANDVGIQQDKILLSDAVFTDLAPNMPESKFSTFVKETSNGDLLYNGTLFAHVDAAVSLLYSNFQIF